MIRIGVRAGLLGAIAAFVIEFLVLVPLAGQCLVWIFNIALWVGLGVLVAYWQPPHARTEDLALGGAVAGFISGLVGGLLGVLLVPILLLLFGGTAGMLRFLPPSFLAWYRDMGIAPEVLFSPTGLFLVMSLTCGLQLVLGPVISALSAVLLAPWLGPEEEYWEEDQEPYMLEW